MYLKNISIRNFKTLAKLNLSLDRGLNILFGANETGKSTFLDALHAVLFEKADSTKAEVLRYRSWGSDADPAILAVIVADGKDFEVEKQFLGAKKGRLSCKVSGLDTTNKDRINEELAKIVPLYTSDGKSLKNTFWIQQSELENTIHQLKEDADVRAAVQSVIFKSDGDLESIKATIADKITEIGKGWQRPAKYLGPLAQSKKELDHFQNEVAELQSQLASIESDVKKHKELTEKVSALEAQIRGNEEVLAAVEKYSQAKNNLHEANKKLDDVQEAIGTIQENEKRIVSLKGSITEIQSKRKECQEVIASIELEQKRADIEARLKAEQSLLQSVHELDKRIADVRSKVTQLPAISKDVLATARKLTSNIEVKRESLRASQISVEAKALSDIEFKVSVDGSEQSRESLRAQEFKTFRANQNLQVTIPKTVELNVTSGVSDALTLQQELKETEQSLADILTKHRAGTVQELVERFEAQQQLTSNLTNLETELRAKLSSRSIEEVQQSTESLTVQIQTLTTGQPPYVLKEGETLQSRLQEQNELLQEFANVSAELRQRETDARRFLDAYGDLSAATQRKKELAREAAKAEAAFEEIPKMELAVDQIFLRQKRLENSKTEHAKSRDELLKISGAIQKLTVSSDQVRLKEAELTEAQAVFQSNLIEFEAYKILSDTLNEAEVEVSKHFMQPIEHIVTTILPRLTMGRYSGISLKESLEIEYVKYSTREVEPNDLSTGAQGQLALALRLALIKHLAGKERQLVVIDDALVNFDFDRLNEAKKLIFEFANSHQVIYLSCHPEILSWDGAHVLKL